MGKTATTNTHASEPRLASEVLLARLAPATGVSNGKWTPQVFSIKGRNLLLSMLQLMRAAKDEASFRFGRLVRRWFGGIAVKVDTLIRGRVGYSLSVLDGVDTIIDEAAIEGALVLSGPLKAGAENGYRIVGRLMNVPLPDPSRTALGRAGGEIASRIVGINETTRSQIRGAVTAAVEDGRTPAELAQTIKDRIEGASRARAMTIARTEMGRAYDKGAIEGFTQGGQVSHVSVIGCQAREPGSPTYRGESTCNIEDVPISDAPSLEFHPNHTGVIVPSRFYGDE